MEETAPSWRDARLWLFGVFGAAVALFGFPPGELWVLAVFSMVPLTSWAVRRSPREAARAGFVYGIGFFLGLIHWIAYTLTAYGYLHWVISVPILLLFAAYLALYPMFFAWLVSRAAKRRGAVHGLLIAPFAWTGLEWARGKLFTGFGWGEVPLALWKEEFALGAAPALGLTGVLFLVMLVNSGAVWLFLPREEKKKAKIALALPLLAVVIWVFALSFSGSGRVIKKGGVGVVQGNIEQGTKWAPVHKEEILKIYRDLTVEVAKTGPLDFVLWPETAVPGFFQYGAVEKKAVESAASVSKTPIIFGAPAFEAGEGGKREDRNGVFSVNEAGKIVGRYDKVHLVPFGEYVPLQKIIPFISKLTQASGDFRPGEGVAPVPFGNEGLKAGPLVCFESIFQDLAAKQAEAGANVLVVLTNDAWFGDTSAPYQHLAYSAWRAAENGLWLVRAANTGISAVFDSRGRLIKSLPMGERGAFTAEVEFRKASGHMQAKVASYLGPLSLLLAAAYLFAILRAPKRTGFQKP